MCTLLLCVLCEQRGCILLSISVCAIVCVFYCVCRVCSVQCVVCSVYFGVSCHIEGIIPTPRANSNVERQPLILPIMVSKYLVTFFLVISSIIIHCFMHICSWQRVKAPFLRINLRQFIETETLASGKALLIDWSVSSTQRIVEFFDAFDCFLLFQPRCLIFARLLAS